MTRRAGGSEGMNYAGHSVLCHGSSMTNSHFPELALESIINKKKLYSAMRRQQTCCSSLHPENMTSIKLPSQRSMILSDIGFICEPCCTAYLQLSALCPEQHSAVWTPMEPQAILSQVCLASNHSVSLPFHPNYNSLPHL